MHNFYLSTSPSTWTRLWFGSGSLQSLRNIQRSWPVSILPFCYTIIKSIETSPYQLHLITSVKQGTLEDYAIKRPVLGTLTLKWLGLVHSFYSSR